MIVCQVLFLRLFLNEYKLIIIIFYTKLALNLTPLLSPRTQKEGSFLQIHCGLQEGSPPLFFEWAINGQTVKSSPDVNYKIENFEMYSTFTIRKIERRDAANYSCIATDSVASDRQTVVLNINGMNENN